MVDHPEIPSDFVPRPPIHQLSTVVLTRRDWDFLFGQLKSTNAVAAYIERISDDAIELGTEPLRYHDLALADLAAKPDPLDPKLMMGRGRPFSSPPLPIPEVGSEDEPSHRMFRVILEDIALAGIDVDEDARLRVLAELDRLPVTLRGSIGRYLLDGLAEMSRVPSDQVEWRLRRVLGGRGTEHLAFGVASAFSDEVRDVFGHWVCLRHHQTGQRLGDAPLTTVGVLLTPRHDRRPWDTTMVAVTGDVSFEPGELDKLQQLFPLEAAEWSAE